MSQQCPAPLHVGAGEDQSAQNAVADGPVTHLSLPAKQRPDTEHGLRIAGAAQFLWVGFLKFQDADFRGFVDHDVHLLVHAPTVRSDCTHRSYPGLNIGRDKAVNCNGFTKGNTMDRGIFILLIAQGECFALWTGLSFRAVFQIRAIARESQRTDVSRSRVVSVGHGRLAESSLSQADAGSLGPVAAWDNGTIPRHCLRSWRRGIGLSEPRRSQ